MFWQVCILHDSYISALRFKVSSQLGKEENIHQKQTDVRPIAGPAASKSSKLFILKTKHRDQIPFNASLKFEIMALKLNKRC